MQEAIKDFCSLERFSIVFMFHISSVLGVLLIVPSPEQGASNKILSNKKSFSLNFCKKQFPSSPCDYAIL